MQTQIETQHSVNQAEEWVRLCDTLETKKKSPNTAQVT